MVRIDRRSLIAGAAAAAVALPHRVRAQTVSPAIRVGSMTVRTLADGHMSVGLDRLTRTPDAPATRTAIAAAGVTADVRFAVNVTLIEAEGARILVDAGAGGTWMDSAGKLADALTTAGVAADSIDLVVLTHAHPDHLWGVIDDFDDSLRFPKATYAIPDAEFAFWMSPTAPEAAGAAEGVTAGARRILKRIEAKLARVKAGADIRPGLAYIEAHGHTPGQCAVLASASGSDLLVAADTIFHPVVSLRHPDWQPAQDMDGPAAVASRRRLIDLSITRQALVSAYHVAAPGLARIERGPDGPRWVAA